MNDVDVFCLMNLWLSLSISNHGNTINTPIADIDLVDTEPVAELGLVETEQSSTYIRQIADIGLVRTNRRPRSCRHRTNRRTRSGRNRTIVDLYPVRIHQFTISLFHTLAGILNGSGRHISSRQGKNTWRDKMK